MIPERATVWAPEFALSVTFAIGFNVGGLLKRFTATVNVRVAVLFRVWPSFTVIAILIGFGHSILAMSGEESLAQVYREIEQPKVKNLQRAGLVIFVYSMLFTSLVSFFALALIPDAVRPKYFDNLISGLAMHLVGPDWVRLLFQAFVVIVGCTVFGT